MAGIDLTGKDPFAPFMPNTNRVLNADIGSGSGAGSLLASLAPAIGSLFGSDSGRTSTISANAVGAPISQNNSGWSVTNRGNATAQAGSQTTSAGINQLPWYVWLIGGLLFVSVIRGDK